jgi:RNA polymerase sigma factor (sigma-70 family)
VAGHYSARTRQVSRRDPLANPEPLIRRVYAYVAYRVGDGPDAEDITSATFERALRGQATYDPDKGAPLAWLLGIARHCISDLTSGRDIPTGSIPDTPDAANLEDSVVRHVTLAAALAQLDPHDQDIIALRYGADLTARRIGEILGMTTNATEVALHRALGRLRVILAAQDPARPDSHADH